MEALDLFCRAGGSSMGIFHAGFNVTGVDIEPQPEYPFKFVLANVLDLSIEFLRKFDIIFASPPCQGNTSILNNRPALKQKYQDNHSGILNRTRDMLIESGVPYVIENVPQAKELNPSLKLCGTMFGLPIFRHRFFETSFMVMMNMDCNHKDKKVVRKTNDGGNIYQLAGHNRGTVEVWQKAIGINWITNKHDLAQAIPPVYTKYICEQFLINNDDIF